MQWPQIHPAHRKIVSPARPFMKIVWRLSGREFFFLRCIPLSSSRTDRAVVTLIEIGCSFFQEAFSLQDGLGAEHCFDVPWNIKSEVPLQRWLLESQSEEDRQRLRTMGNVVVPLQATRAFNLLSQMHL